MYNFDGQFGNIFIKYKIIPIFYLAFLPLEISVTGTFLQGKKDVYKAIHCSNAYNNLNLETT